MLSAMEDALIAGREPELRVVAIIERFLDHADIKRLTSLLARRHLGIDKSELAGQALG